MEQKAIRDYLESSRKTRFEIELNPKTLVMGNSGEKFCYSMMSYHPITMVGTCHSLTDSNQVYIQNAKLQDLNEENLALIRGTENITGSKAPTDYKSILFPLKEIKKIKRI